MIGGLPYLSSLFMEHVIGLKPCHLCLYQRYLHVTAAGIGVLALIFSRYNPATKIFFVIAIATVTANFGVAFYHSGVERHIFKGPDSCSGEASSGKTIEDIKQQIMSAELVRCDVAAARILGLSLSELNAILCLSIIIFLLYVRNIKHDT